MIHFPLLPPKSVLRWHEIEVSLTVLFLPALLLLPSSPRF